MKFNMQKIFKHVELTTRDGLKPGFKKIWTSQIKKEAYVKLKPLRRNLF